MMIHDRCKCPVLDKEEVAISEGYSYYCPNCDEDLYAFETAVATATATKTPFAISSEVIV
jgi:hypothetical protein